MAENLHYQLIPQKAPDTGGSPSSPTLQRKAAESTLPPVIAALYWTWFFILYAPMLFGYDGFHNQENSWSVWSLLVYGVFFNTVFGLFLASIIQAIRTDAGAVPVHWGFYVGDDARRRRYCRICNVWKPDRTHHCSSCGRCVLNMDHHCPWINNCVGFYNRKFFIQALYYATACLMMILGHGFYYLIQQAQRFWPDQYYDADISIYNVLAPADYLSWMLIVAVEILTAMLLAALIPFSRFHWQLLVTNSTTIESMDPPQRVDSDDRPNYDLGRRRNIEQVTSTVC